MGCCCCTVVVIGWVKGGVAQLMMTMVRKRRRSEGGGGRRRGVLRICTVQYEQKNYLLCIIRYGVVCGEEKGSQSQFMFFSCLSIYLPKPCMHGRMHTNVIHYFSDQTHAHTPSPAYARYSVHPTPPVLRIYKPPLLPHPTAHHKISLDIYSPKR